MSEWIHSKCPRCGQDCETPIWDDGECPCCQLPFTFDPDRGMGLLKPSKFYWGVPGWRYYAFDARERPEWAGRVK